MTDNPGPCRLPNGWYGKKSQGAMMNGALNQSLLASEAPA